MRNIYFLWLFFAPIALNAQQTFEIDPGSYRLDFEQSIEYPYILADTTNIWIIAEPHKPILFLPEDQGMGKKAIFTDTNTYYANGVNTAFQLKIKFGDVGSYVYEMAFRHKYDFEKHRDGGIIETSYDDGLTWQNILFDTVMLNNLIDDPLGLYTSEDTVSAYDNQPGYTGLCAEIASFFIYFTSSEYISGKTMLLRFTMASDNHDAGNEGWMIDQILLVGRYGAQVIDRTEPHHKVNLFSLPGKDMIAIQSDTETITRVNIISATGETVQKETGTDIKTINIAGLQPGIYLVVCENRANERWVNKFYRL